MTDIPNEKLAEHVRKQALLDCDMTIVDTPESVRENRWDHLEEADIESVQYDEGDGLLTVVLADSVTLKTKVADATRQNPACYDHHDATAEFTIKWAVGTEQRLSVELGVIGG